MIIELTKEEFEKTIEACSETLIRNKDVLWNIYNNESIDIDINFRFRADEIVTMNISSTQSVHPNDIKIYGENK